MEEKRMNRVNSPEQLNQYIKLSNPGVWVILAAIIILLIGVCIWGLFGKIDNKLKTVVIVDNYIANCYIKEDDITKVENGMKLEINDNFYEINFIDEKPKKVDDSFSDYIIKAGNLKYGEWVYKCGLNTMLPNGVYSGDIIIESIAPSTFIIN